MEQNRKSKNSRYWYYVNRVYDLDKKYRKILCESKEGKNVQNGSVDSKILRVKVHVIMFVKTIFQRNLEKRKGCNNFNNF